MFWNGKWGRFFWGKKTPRATAKTHTDGFSNCPPTIQKYPRIIYAWSIDIYQLLMENSSFPRSTHACIWHSWLRLYSSLVIVGQFVFLTLSGHVWVIAGSLGGDLGELRRISIAIVEKISHMFSKYILDICWSTQHQSRIHLGPFFDIFKFLDNPVMWCPAPCKNGV